MQKWSGCKIDTIFTINARDNVGLQVSKECFNLSNDETKEEIWNEFDKLCRLLNEVGVAYSGLKSALVPVRDKEYIEACFVFDSTKVSDSFYGKVIYRALLGGIDKKGTRSILHGDFIDITGRVNQEGRDKILCHLANEVGSKVSISRGETFEITCLWNLYLIYFNKMKYSQVRELAKSIRDNDWYVGWMDLSEPSILKSYLSKILCHAFVQNKSVCIVSCPSDWHEKGYEPSIPLANFGFSVKTIPDYYYDCFLSYKIESFPADEDDIAFSVNALTPRHSALNGAKIRIDDKKWNFYLNSPDKKGGLVKSLANVNSKSDLIRLIEMNIGLNYIYNLRIKENALLFDICLYCKRENGSLRKTTVACRYNPGNNCVSVVTLV